MKKQKAQNIKLRYNIITAFVYIAGIILLAGLFNLQIIHGEEYRKTSEIKLTRETVSKAARGSIKDNSGNVLAGTEIGFSLELYKTKLENDTLNSSILNMINVLEQNGDTYIDTFPIKVEPFEFIYSEEEKQNNWKIANKINSDYSAEQCFNFFKEKYGVKIENNIDARKIINVRYRISQEGYSSTKSIVISKNISKTSVLLLQEQNDKFPGINIITEATRTYPFGNLASHIIGYINNIGNEYEEAKAEDNRYTPNDLFGKSGIERSFEKYLKGTNGIKQIDMTVDGTITGEYVAQEAQAGADVILTIDANFQSKVEEILENSVNSVRGGSTGGSIVVMNVNTGAILAMASYPTFSPSAFIGGIDSETWNSYINPENNKPLTNRSIQSIYAPGSTFKMLTAIAGLETGAIDENTRINDTGIYPRGHNPACWIYRSTRGGHGWLNVTQALQRSCNYFFYDVGYRTGIDNIYRYARYFGLDSKTGVELPAEAKGNAAQQSSAGEAGWYVADTLVAAIGQGYNSFTPIEMAKYVSMIANGGKRLRPTLIKSVLNADGSEVSREEIRTYMDDKLGIDTSDDENLSISEETINTVKRGMLAVTSEPGGTAYATFNGFGVKVAGKTGTADVADTGDIANGWFVGFAPYNEPEIAIAAVIENGGSGAYATAASKEVLAQYFGMNWGKITEDRTTKSYIESIN